MGRIDRQDFGQIVTTEDLAIMSDRQLYLFLQEHLPAVAEVVVEVGAHNRAVVVALLRFLSNETK